MALKRTHFVAEVFVVSCLAAVLCRELSSDFNHESATHDSVKHGSVVEPKSSRADRAGGSTIDHDDVHPHPPKHVMKLMQRMSQDGDLLKQRGNTVRSYLPTLRFTCNEPTYVFSVRPYRADNLLSVELHFFSLKPSNLIGSTPTISIYLHLITDTSSKCHPIGVHQRPAEARGWQAVDVTSQISQFVNVTNSDASRIALGVSFRVHMTTGYDSIHDSGTIEKIVSNHARPFFLMYSQEDESGQTMNSVLPWTEERAKYVPPKVITPPRKRAHTRHARSVDDKPNPIMTNEFPEGNTNLAHQATFQHFTEQDSKRRKAKKRASKKRRGAGKKHGKATLLDPSSSAVEDMHMDSEETMDDRDQNTVLSVDPSSGACSRHPMFVGFDTIDWDRYVIAPSGFEAFYCAGDCSFPLSKTANPSNHAAIQSVMSVTGTQPKIPPPCCVPKSLSSLTILFFDEDNNLELKTYQNMVVESCGCR